MSDGEAAGVPVERNSWGLLWYWSPLFLWFAAIFVFSGDAMSAEHTSGFIEPLLRRLLPGTSEHVIYAVHVAVRKSGHVGNYAFLALLAFRALRSGRSGPWRWSWAAGAVAIAVGYAAADEFHQTFVASRTGTVDDVAIDAIGAAAAMCVLGWFRMRQSRREQPTRTD